METQSRPGAPRIEETIRTGSPAEVAAALREATESGKPVIPVGGGTVLHTGNPTDESYLALDMSGLSGIREYHPTDLTVSINAGTTLADVQAALGEHGQELPVDMVMPATATLGGMVATGFAGPRRLGAGTLKDLIIGCEYVRGDGLVAKAGGMLVKNVSGFEIPRFLQGSWGSLAILTSINLKVVPKPKADVTFVHIEDRLEASLDGQLGLLRSHPGIVAVVSEKVASGWAMAVRLMGRRASLDAQLASFRNELGSHTETSDGSAYWEQHNERWGAVDHLARYVVSGRSGILRDLAIQVEQALAPVAMSVSLGTGTLRIGLDPSSVSREDVEARLRLPGVSWVVESAPPSWIGTESVWGPSRGDIGLARAIKAEFDPANVLNRGRLFI